MSYRYFTTPAGLALHASACRPSFVGSFSQGASNETLSFAVASLAEVSRVGTVVALEDLAGPLPSAIASDQGPSSITFTDRLSSSVSNATGSWLPSDTACGSGSQKFHGGSQVLGMASVTLTFYLRWGGANDSSLTFNLNESGWPWVSSSDQLGVELDSTAASGSELAYSSGSATLTEAAAGGGAVEANLVLGPNAAATGGAPTSLSVSTQAGIFSSGASNNLAAILLTLGGPGGYAGFSYGPSLTFFPLPVKIAPQTLGVLSIAAIGLVVVAAVILGVLGIRARRVPPEADLAPLNPSGRGKGTAHRPGPSSPFAPTS